MENDANQFWFKRKTYGWGWTPVKWQGWLSILVYIALVILFSRTLNQDSSIKEAAFRFILPIATLTALLIRIAYAKGEKPKWQWGKDTSKHE